ncbi:hypothetical protein SESBI_44294 [Sesbania bispinosa]|nr:hypothetical protein SESBI_44294 [Sesbania bispinosa]
MAFDQNSVPIDLRALNVVPTMAEELHVSPASTTPPTPNSARDLFYTPSASATTATWCVRPMAHPAAIGFNYGCGFGNRVAPGNALNLGNWVGANGLDKACNDSVAVNGYAYGGAVGGTRVSDDTGDDSVSGRKVKFLCSFGGKILPRPSDGMLRYVGGQTRIISVRRDSLNFLLVRCNLGTCKILARNIFDAVNGLSDGNGISGGIKRKGGEPMVSPKENVAASPDISANLVMSEPSTAGTSAVSLGMPVVKTSPTHTPYFQNEVELEKSVPVTLSQQPFGLQQSGMEVSPPFTLFAAFCDTRQEVMNHADYVHLPPQLGFPNPHLLGKTGHVFTQQQFHDNTPTSLAFHQVNPGAQMTMTPTSSHVGVRPTVIQQQPLMQQQQNRLDQYSDENTSGIGLSSFLLNKAYNTYQVPVNQVPSVIVGGNYGWVQVPSQEPVVFSDGLLPQQQVMIPEESKELRAVLCVRQSYLMPIQIQWFRISIVVVQVPVPDSSPSYHSMPMEDIVKAQAKNRAKPMVTAPLKEGIIEQGAGTRPRVISKFEPPDGVPYTDNTGLSHNLEPQPEGGRIFMQKPEEFDHTRIHLSRKQLKGQLENSLPVMGSRPWEQHHCLI